jgi:hypothetical protein
MSTSAGRATLAKAREAMGKVVAISIAHIIASGRKTSGQRRFAVIGCLSIVIKPNLLATEPYSPQIVGKLETCRVQPRASRRQNMGLQVPKVPKDLR